MNNLEKAIAAFETALEEPVAEAGTINFYAIIEPAAKEALAVLREKRERGQNDPLTLGELRGMDQERVWVQFCGLGMYALVAFQSDPDGDDGDDVYLTNNLGGRNTYEEIISEGGEIYRRPPER